MTLTCIYAGDQGDGHRYPKRKRVERKEKAKAKGKRKNKRNQKSKEPNAESLAGKVVSFPKR